MGNLGIEGIVKGGHRSVSLFAAVVAEGDKAREQHNAATSATFAMRMAIVDPRYLNR